MDAVGRWSERIICGGFSVDLFPIIVVIRRGVIDAGKIEVRVTVWSFGDVEVKDIFPGRQCIVW